MVRAMGCTIPLAAAASGPRRRCDIVSAGAAASGLGRLGIGRRRRILRLVRGLALGLLRLFLRLLREVALALCELVVGGSHGTTPSCVSDGAEGTAESVNGCHVQRRLSSSRPDARMAPKQTRLRSNAELGDPARTTCRPTKPAR